MRAALLFVFALSCAASCASSYADEGKDARLQVKKGTFRRGAMPEDTTGPRVLSATFPGRIAAGTANQGAAGELERAATAVAVALEGDPGYWIVSAKVPAASLPTSPAFGFGFGISNAISAGPHAVIVRAVDGTGHFGPAQLETMNVVAGAGPAGRFVVRLTWEDQADLNLHVVIPNGVEIFKGNPAEYQLPDVNSGAIGQGRQDGGLLDRDSNARCILDGQRAEDVVWNEAPPTGHYLVRVDTFSLCGAASAHWRLEAVLDGVRIGSAEGTSTDNELRFAHGRGAGLLALELDVP